MIKPLMASALALGLTLGPINAIAQGLDNQAPMVCSVNETFDCASARACIGDSPEAVNIPRVIRIDFAAKKAFTKKINGEVREASIGAEQLVNERMILQGIQNGLAWSMAISRESGAMALTITAEDAGFVVFGTCMGL
jgi:hypothetical protein